MELKTYQARSMSDALAKVKSELGRDAVILHTRTIKRGGFLGIGAQSMVEISATADPRLGAMRAAAKRGEFDPGRSGSGAKRQATCDPARSDANVGDQGSPTPAVAASAPAPSPARMPESAQRQAAQCELGAAEPGDVPLRTEVNEIRGMVRDLLRQSNDAWQPQLPAELVDQYTQLIGQDVARELAVQLLDRVEGKMRRCGSPYRDDRGRLVSATDVSPDWIRRELQEAVVEMLPAAEPLALGSGVGPTVVAVVGPTGVGKTTTIAKLAANMKLREGKSVGLITIDTYRIAAVEQLKTYSEILEIPLTAVTSPEDMRPAIERMSDVELVLIDTAGRSQKDELRIGELRRFIEAAKPNQVHLVLSSTSREEAIREAIRNFSVLGVKHLIFTKLDEAVGLGVILNVLRSVDMRLSYLTNGQSVPADIEAGSAKRVAELILEAKSTSALSSSRPSRSPPPSRPQPPPPSRSVSESGPAAPSPLQKRLGNAVPDRETHRRDAGATVFPTAATCSSQDCGTGVSPVSAAMTTNPSEGCSADVSPASDHGSDVCADGGSEMRVDGASPGPAYAAADTEGH